MLSPITEPLGYDFFLRALLASAMVGAMIVHIAVLHDPILIVAPLALLAAVVVVAARDPGLDLIARRED